MTDDGHRLSLKAQEPNAGCDFNLGMQRRPHRNIWTREADDELRSMLLAGKSVASISARLKRTTNAVKVRAAMLGLSIASDRTLRAQRNAAKRAINNVAHSGWARRPVVPRAR
jgi:hypothetical protein